MREDRFRKAAKERRTLFNAWLTLNNPFLIELIGEAGWDCLTIDQQHGLGGNEALLGCLTAARACGLPAIVRVAENDPGLIGRALDAGAQGIMCPLIGSVEDAEAFVQAVKYPPRGNRSWGPYRARLDHEGDYFKTANDWTIACPQIETKGALDQLDEILALDGVDMVCFGPNDLSVALTGRLDIWAPEVKEAMTLVLSKCREMSVMALIFANDADYAKPRVAEGWDVVAVGTDAGWFSKAAAEVKAAAKATLRLTPGSRCGKIGEAGNGGLPCGSIQGLMILLRARALRRRGRGRTRSWGRPCERRGLIPVYPPYPYRSGYYPKADWYYDLPPYAAIKPNFYRKRYFMMAQERNRYRYMPHIFTRL